MDDLERIHVGPESAGSEPGPAAYGRGGRVHVPGARKLRVKGRKVVPPGHWIVMPTPGGWGTRAAVRATWYARTFCTGMLPWRRRRVTAA